MSNDTIWKWFRFPFHLMYLFNWKCKLFLWFIFCDRIRNVLMFYIVYILYRVCCVYHKLPNETKKITKIELERAKHCQTNVHTLLCICARIVTFRMTFGVFGMYSKRNLWFLYHIICEFVNRSAERGSKRTSILYSLFINCIIEEPLILLLWQR